MKMRVTPGYSDLFGATGTLDEYLNGLPNANVVSLLSWLNAQFLETSSPLERDKEIRGLFTSNMGRREVIALAERFFRAAGYDGGARVFHSLYLTHFIQHELTNHRDVPERQLTDDEMLRVFKAYLVIVDRYNDHLGNIPEVDSTVSHLEFFNRRTWPMLFPQHEFNRDVDAFLALVQVHILFQELEQSKYAACALRYCQTFGCADGYHLVRKLLGILRVSRKTNDGKNRVFRLDQITHEYRPLLDNLVHGLGSSNVPWNPGSLAALKQYPLYKLNEDQYVVLNWDYLYRAMYEAIVRDFYVRSGVAAMLAKPEDFKSWVSSEVIEKRVFRTVIEIMYKDHPELIGFPSAKTPAHSDAYIRQGRHVLLLEFKDTDIPDSLVTNFDYDALEADLKEKHLRNKYGKAKSVLQLARNAKAIMQRNYPDDLYGRYKTKELWIHPVLVCSGYLYSAPGMNDLLNDLYEKHREVRTAPLVVLTMEYLFRKIVDLQPAGLLGALEAYASEKKRRLKRFRKYPDPEGAFKAFASIEEVCPIRSLPYKAQKHFIRELYEKLGLSH